MVFAQWFWVFFKTSHITRTTKSLLLHQQYCDDYQLKGCVAQTSEGLNSGVLHLRPIRVAALRNALGHCGTLCGTCWNLRLSAKKSLDFIGLQGQQAAATVIAILRRRPLRSLGVQSEGLLFPTRTCIKTTTKHYCKSCLPRQSTACTEVGQCASKIRSLFGSSRRGLQA